MSDQYKSRVEKRRKEQLKKSTGKKGNKSKKTIAKKIFLTLLVSSFIVLIGGIIAVGVMISRAPEFDAAKLKDPVPSKIYDMNDELLTTVGTENRDLVEFDEIPDLVKNAVLATEDVRFFDHHGIDLIRLGGAVISNITEGFGSQGASTLTQQVVKMSFLSYEKTIERKVQEAWLAFQLERNFSKEEIFEMYVNKVNMGGNVRGIKAAAKTYFGKELNELTLPEAAVLAGLPQRPNDYNPFINPDKADKRKNTVLYLMNMHGFITDEEMEEAQAVSVASLIVEPVAEEETDDTYLDSFIDEVIDEVEKLGYNIFTDGLEIYTTIDKNTQKLMYEILNTDKYVNFPDDEIQAGVVLLDTKTGQIRAIGGGRHQSIRRGLNYAMDIKRPPGSTIKPVLAYGPAIEKFKWSTYHMIKDEPHTYSDGTKFNNWDNKYTGTQTIRYHIQHSRNIPAVKAIQEVGLDAAYEFGTRLGVPLPETMGEAYALGGFDTGIAPVHLAGAYSAFGNNGIYNEPHVVRKIVLADGMTEFDLTPEPKAAMSDYTAFLLTDMLKTVVESGTGREAKVPGVPIAGKTGTTNYTEDQIKKWGVKGSPDAWFSGYSTLYTAAVWVGYDDMKKPTNTLLPEVIFQVLMSNVHSGKEVSDFSMPNSVVRMAIEKGSNPPKLPSPFTPSDQITYEYFVKGTEPTEISETYNEVPAVENLTVEYEHLNNRAVLNWEYTSDVKDIQFEVWLSVDGAERELIHTTDKKGLEVTEVVPNHKYVFTVIAKLGDQVSDPVSVELDPKTLLKDIWDQIFPPDDEENNEDENRGNNRNGNNSGNNNENNNNNNNNNGNGNQNGHGDNNEGQNDETDHGEKETPPEDESNDGSMEEILDGIMNP